MKNLYQSWGRLPKVTADQVIPVRWYSEIPKLFKNNNQMLCYGLGRSYGDSCLNENGTLIDMSFLNHFMKFDHTTGILTCESGISLDEILKFAVPKGWFLPVTPGTKYVTVGGAIANDVHGKNHHCAGTFGCFVKRFEIIRSTGERMICSETENLEMYKATIGGLGLTGIISWAEIALKPISTPFISMESIRFNDLEHFFELSKVSEKDYEYIVAWVDSTAKGAKLGRGIFLRGNHASANNPGLTALSKEKSINFPVDAPEFLLNRFSVQLFNSLYYYKQWQKQKRTIVHYNPFFYPLDNIQNWNRMYGKRGFYQYQCVMPYKDGYDAIKEMLQRIAKSGHASFLAVLKTFGDVPSPGIMSFPRPGVTLALDFPNYGDKTLALFDALDAVVKQASGALYPAKDARMSQVMFKLSFPNLDNFREYIDPKFSSSFWRRVNSDENVDRISASRRRTVA